MALIAVVPHAGTWIEIKIGLSSSSAGCVVPHAGTWIEMERSKKKWQINQVVPHAGTWIEIQMISTPAAVDQCRSPRGNVD